MGGVVSYTSTVKTNELGVPKEVIEKYGAVSNECAIAMAEGALKKFGTIYSLSITGIAGPDGGMKEKPVGMVWIALGEMNRITIAKLFKFAGDRAIIRERSVDSALEVLRRRLLE
jgi:PncC family amidohydrolase